MSFFSVECKEQSLNKLLVKRMSKCISVKGYNLGNLNIGLLIIWGPGFEQMGSIRISERNRCEVLGKNTNQSSTREQLQTCDFLFTRLSFVFTSGIHLFHKVKVFFVSSRDSRGF